MSAGAQQGVRYTAVLLPILELQLFSKEILTGGFTGERSNMKLLVIHTKIATYGGEDEEDCRV